MSAVPRRSVRLAAKAVESVEPVEPVEPLMFVPFIEESLGFNTHTGVSFIQYTGNEEAIKLLNEVIDKIGEDAYDHECNNHSDYNKYTLEINNLIPEEHIDIIIKYSFGETYYSKYTGKMNIDKIKDILNNVNDNYVAEADDDNNSIFYDYDNFMMNLDELFPDN